MSALDPDYLRTVALVCAWRGEAVDGVCASLLLIGLRSDTFDAGMIPQEVCGESTTVAGIATGRLIAIGLIEVTGRCRSSSPNANGRKCNLLRLTPGKRHLVLKWLEQRGYHDSPTETQTAMFA
jgi:hypothetical protein